MPTPKRYNTTQAAEHLGVRPRTLMNWRHRGSGPVFVKIGRSVYYTEQALDTYLASRTFQKVGDPPVNQANQ